MVNNSKKHQATDVVIIGRLNTIIIIIFLNTKVLTNLVIWISKKRLFCAIIIDTSQAMVKCKAFLPTIIIYSEFATKI